MGSMCKGPEVQLGPSIWKNIEEAGNRSGVAEGEDGRRGGQRGDKGLVITLGLVGCSQNLGFSPE